MRNPSCWGGITLGAEGDVPAALCCLVLSLSFCVASCSSLGGALSLALSAAGSGRSGKQGGIDAAQGLASSWERAEAWQSRYTEAAGWDARPWSCSSSFPLPGAAGLQPSSCLPRVLGLPWGAAAVQQGAGSSPARGLPGGPALLVALLPPFPFPVPSHGVGQQQPGPWAELRDAATSSLLSHLPCSPFPQGSPRAVRGRSWRVMPHS